MKKIEKFGIIRFYKNNKLVATYNKKSNVLYEHENLSSKERKEIASEADYREYTEECL